jgi:hypothetical protein
MTRLATAIATALVPAVAVVSFVAVPALARGSDSALLTFDGQCQFAGTSSFSSPVTLAPSRVRDEVAAAGTCSGSLTRPGGRTTQLSSSPVRYRATESGASESCQLNPNASGSGELIFEAGRLSFSVTENRVSGQAALSYSGRSSGSAQGVAYVTSDPTTLLEQCAAGGISSAAVSIVFATTTAITG